MTCKQEYEEFRKQDDGDLDEISRNEFLRAIYEGDSETVAMMDAAMITGFYRAWEIQQQTIEKLKSEDERLSEEVEEYRYRLGLRSNYKPKENK